MEVLLFSASYHSEPEAFPMGFSQLASYYWLQQALLTLFMTRPMEEKVFQTISNGITTYELCRLVDTYSMWFVKSLANRASKAVLRCMPTFSIALLLPKSCGLALPPDVRIAVLFLLSVILGFLVVVAFSMPAHTATFSTLSPLGIRIISLPLVEFMSGGIIPLPFLPDRIRGIMELLLFASMQNVLYRIYSANIAGAAAVNTLPLQLFWIIALTVLGHCLISLALRHAVIRGD